MKQGFQGEGIKEDQKHYKKTCQTVRNEFLFTELTDETEISDPDTEPEVTSSDDEEEDFTSSMPSSGRVPRKPDRPQAEQI